MPRIAENANDAGPYLKRGEVRLKLHEFEDAIDDFSSAINLKGHLDHAYCGRGMALGRSGRFDDSITDFGVYIGRHPESSRACTERGSSILSGRGSGKAEKNLTKVIALNPTDARAHDDLAVMLAQRGDYAAAVQHFMSTIALDPSCQKANHNLAMVYYYCANHNHEALATVDKALKLVSDSRDSLLLKATILEARGRHSEARKIKDEAEFHAPRDAPDHAAVQ
ncbi:MAG TPA: tetratricopeptide repeat protein [Candidatus Methylomirabilis sp.]|nr:tetratricopeptide repeat protein [Candidatus Methylomirabilis sp.]